MKKTLFAVKFRTSNDSRAVWQLLGLFIGFGLLLGLVAAGEIVLCHRDHPGLPVMDCLRGIRK